MKYTVTGIPYKNKAELTLMRVRFRLVQLTADDPYERGFTESNMDKPNKCNCDVGNHGSFYTFHTCQERKEDLLELLK